MHAYIHACIHTYTTLRSRHTSMHTYSTHILLLVVLFVLPSLVPVLLFTCSSLACTSPAACLAPCNFSKPPFPGGLLLLVLYQLMGKSHKHDSMDFDEVIQKQFATAEAEKFNTDFILGHHSFLDWAAAEASQGANREWFWCGALSSTAYNMDFLRVNIHPGWSQTVSRNGVLIANPGANKDAPVNLNFDAMRNIQTKYKKLTLLDEFSIPFLYQALKGNDCRMLGLYTELDSLLQKCCQNSPGQVVDAKTRMIRIYDCRHWGYGLKGEESYTYETMEEIPKTLFPIWGAVQPEVWYNRVWEDALSGFWQRWSCICIPQIDVEWAANPDDHTSRKELVDSWQTTFENTRTAAAELKRANEAQGCPAFDLEPDTYKAFGGLFARIKDIKKANKSDPIVLASASKVLRETINTMGCIYALDQAADNLSAFDTNIPVLVFDRAVEQVRYHMAVALRGRPPCAVSTTCFDLKIDDTVQSVRLRRQFCRIRGSEVAGSDLKKAGVFETQTPEDWRKGDGYLLEKIGVLTINRRSYGFSVTKTPVPNAESDAGALEVFKTALHKELNMTIDEYHDTFTLPVRAERRKKAPAPAAGSARAAGSTAASAVKRSTSPEVKKEPASVKAEVLDSDEDEAPPAAAIPEPIDLSDADDAGSAPRGSLGKRRRAA